MYQRMSDEAREAWVTEMMTALKAQSRKEWREFWFDLFLAGGIVWLLCTLLLPYL